MFSKIFLTLLFSVLFFIGCVQQQSDNITNKSMPLDNIKVEKNENQTNFVTVYIRNFAFVPQSISIKKGDVVIWINEDRVLHTVTSEGYFDSGLLNYGQNFTFVFHDVGKFDYICRPHPYMKGSIIVEE